MAEPQATDQEGATPKPEAAERLPSSDKRGAPVSERDWLTQKRRERRTVVEAVTSIKESAEQPSQAAEVPQSVEEPTTETSREAPAEGSESAEAQTEAEAQEAPQGETEGEEGYLPETLNEFAEAIGVEPKDFLQGVTATVKVNGEERSVPLEDLLHNYSSESERDRLGQALAEERKALEAATQQHEQQYQERLRQADEYLYAMRSSIDLGPDDAKLAEMLNTGQIDERGFIAAKAERDAKITAFNGAVQQRNAFAQQQMEEQQTKLGDFRKQQQDGLMAWKPDLREPAKLAEFETRIRGGLTESYGFTDDEVSEFFGNFNLRQLKIVDDALAFRQMKTQEKPIKQRLGQLPRLQKPGPKRSAGQQANDKVLGARNRLRSSGSVQDGVALLKAKRLARRNPNHGGSQ